ncbi:MAG: bifunctional UDP-3-O-[3-hydroxymyristoyl] N-acetylglucosamine deacetylase/3-hydroxyacyl-ACP dehydratase [Bacteroidales bacterium]|jgi:UDP-3-O-[3-hydroxymyristoyl] N-acetylglucosamine deacetylase/3-hydroxyacyl-[acyl-carrier-protein] dehydratase|nr:bifunctional UDP-3-O-[3-hydroxymyristoyl] N-acetylglucosamine deacetylase/3-hydroxyacyl-ACP dehydratase [Bacteroidales bacterium]MBQ2395743.1 bifunctional UDP-3-O-[3-hydroxymyristoyl] N-acetylglucosamine deacetylase/3-hydroxyacyl-ACP dehydratase [Bacteroidales bacterium]MBQ5873729.1 bifunctional UDP-3-O-[3-hydroxymyristoyl] N-acetylglucosamine deacetylase/3-hydroxyacyl-ACP dehydratase [Bacteroidales bacterium]MEE1020884.1 bifunctional UDP-3-O-[3-hydroxymyristoyl] N-acetylglucosamine deacetyla
MEKQLTIKNKITLKGKGLHTGKVVEVNILPSEANSGIVFKRVDLETPVIIKAEAEAVSETSRGTTIETKGVKVATIEHLMAALYSSNIDNALIEISGEEVPILDGSAKYWLEAIEKSGVEELDAERKYYYLKEVVTYSDEQNDIELIAMPYDGFRIDLNIDFSPRIIGNQTSCLKNLSEFKEGFSNCRTFVFLDEIEQLLKLNLIKGGDLDNALIFVDKVLEAEQIQHLANVFGKDATEIKVEKGLLNNVKQNFENEPARHKLLDFIGDIALVGKPLKARFIIKRPGHKVNNLLSRKIKTIMENNGAPVYDPNKEPVYDIKAIKNLLPHRFPMLLIDKVIEIGEDYVIGLKNVTGNEDFFNGHFPQEPVMPGVLIVEALGQTGGVLALKDIEDPENYSTYFMKFEEVKFRNKVVPGDTLLLKLTLTEPIRRGIVKMKGEAYVGNRLVVEAQLMAQVAKTKK